MPNGSDNVLNTPGLMDPSTEFGSMMQHAMKIKTAQMDQDRKRFETWPLFLQNTMWMQHEAGLALREIDPPAARLDGARKIKEAGNEHFRNKRYASAVEEYEAAVGAFRYAKQLDPDWKKKGIKDETIDLIDDCDKEGDADGKASINEFLVACYNNLAACYLARASTGQPEPGYTIENDYTLCVQASTFGIEISPSSKALYRRARGLSEPMTANDGDVDKAILDLAEAARLDPEDKAVRTLLTRLRRGRAEKKKEESEAYSGLFGKAESKGGLYDEKTLAGVAQRQEAEQRLQKAREGNRTLEDCENEEKEAEAAIKHLRARGSHADADSLQKKLDEHRAHLNQYKANVAQEEAAIKRRDPRFIDFSNPTQEQIDDAKKHGIDLFDPVVVRELQRMQKEGVGGEGEEGEEGGEGEEGEEGGDGHTGLRYRGRKGDGAGGARYRDDGSAGSDDSSSLNPRTRYTIMAIAIVIGLARVWSVVKGFGQQPDGYGGAAHATDAAPGAADDAW